MTDAELKAFHQARYDELPASLRDKAITGLRETLTPKEKDWLREQIQEHGDDWWCEGGWHFRGGMAVRNMLRDPVGILDHELPSGNWDDYYILITQEAVSPKGYDDWDQW